jgi:hypothetical protein
VIRHHRMIVQHFPHRWMSGLAEVLPSFPLNWFSW